MNEMLKTASDHLLKIAEDLEKEAAKCTIFACESCSHTASLMEINSKIEEALRTASAEGSFELEPVTVNDRVACAVCKSAMSYKPSELSEKFYVEASSKDSAMYKTGPVEEVLDIVETDDEGIDDIKEEEVKSEDVSDQTEKQAVEEDCTQEESDAKKTASQAGVNLDSLGKYLSFGK